MEALQKGLAELYESGEFTDWKIEGSKNSIELKAVGTGEDDVVCDDPETIKLMVHFLYYLDYEAPQRQKVQTGVTEHSREAELLRRGRMEGIRTMHPEADGWFPSPKGKKSKVSTLVAGTPGSDGNLVMHAKIFTAAVKYQITTLQRLASTKFAAAAKVSWDHYTFAEAARIAYTTTPDEFRDLRETVADTIHKHKSLLDKVSIKDLLMDVRPLPVELLRMARGLPAVTSEPKDDVPKCAECESVLYLVECSECGHDYLGCCYGQCQNCGHAEHD
ncbi:hypothetical protein LTR62_000758 [Meristemomyces frigidus]|uniref:Uncharacterized protein n=1 Tax=Meristemomyces frigidus TaxID=1508187 RepID=A0AAN7TNI3_9PEZI|nr:hypothetical protein LTR62_000758 [Meristemomyces frigidus]